MKKLTCIFYLIVCHTARLRAKQIEGMIVGGGFANIINHPHSVFLSFKGVVSGQKESWICGGSIINQKILLTAGHCISDCNEYSDIRAHVGNEHNVKGSLYTISGFKLHEAYDKRKTANDIGLLRTEKTIKFSDKVRRVALMMEPPYFEDSKIAGWGLADIINDVASPKLKYLAQTVRSRSDCVKALNTNVPKGTICAAATSEREFADQGDSGSALVVRGYIQIGLVSHKMPKLDNHLIVYADVGYYYKWIKFYSEALYCGIRG